MMRGLLWCPLGRKSMGRPTGRNHRNTELRGEGVGLRLQALAAAAKKKQPETHDAEKRNRDARDTWTRITMRTRASRRDPRRGMAINHSISSIMTARRDK